MWHSGAKSLKISADEKNTDALSNIWFKFNLATHRLYGVFILHAVVFTPYGAISAAMGGRGKLAGFQCLYCFCLA